MSCHRTVFHILEVLDLINCMFHVKGNVLCLHNLIPLVPNSSNAKMITCLPSIEMNFAVT